MECIFSMECLSFMECPSSIIKHGTISLLHSVDFSSLGTGCRLAENSEQWNTLPEPSIAMNYRNSTTAFRMLQTFIPCFY